MHELGTTVDPSRQQIALDGEPLKIERKKYFVLNKPRGILCTNRDPAGRPRVIDLFPPDSPRLFPVGRLDEESEGLIVVTNDGDLAQKLAHPKYRIYRTYHVHVAGVPNRPTLESLREGMYFAEGKFRVHSAKLLKKQGESSHLEIILTEGQNREVRRLLARIGHKVLRLKRVGFGPIRLERLKPGEFRELTRNELADLHEILQRNVSGPRRREGGPERSSPPAARSASSQERRRPPARAEGAPAPSGQRPARPGQKPGRPGQQSGQPAGQKSGAKSGRPPQKFGRSGQKSGTRPQEAPPRRGPKRPRRGRP